MFRFIVFTFILTLFVSQHARAAETVISAYEVFTASILPPRIANSDRTDTHRKYSDLFRQNSAHLDSSILNQTRPEKARCKNIIKSVFIDNVSSVVIPDSYARTLSGEGIAPYIKQCSAGVYTDLINIASKENNLSYIGLGNFEFYAAGGPDAPIWYIISEGMVPKCESDKVNPCALMSPDASYVGMRVLNGSSCERLAYYPIPTSRLDQRLVQSYRSYTHSKKNLYYFAVAGENKYLVSIRDNKNTAQLVNVLPVSFSGGADHACTVDISKWRRL